MQNNAQRLGFVCSAVNYFNRNYLVINYLNITNRNSFTLNNWWAIQNFVKREFSKD